MLGLNTEQLMKGFTHFISATAIATCIPGAAEYAVNNTSYIIVLGGVFGILPDTLDFKLNRFTHKYDELYDPGENPDPDDIAAVVAKWLDIAYAEKRSVFLHLHTIKVGADLWREYLVRFKENSREIEVEIGGIVNTGKVPVPNSAPEEKKIGRAKVSCDFKQNYSTVTTVNIFSGPSFGFVPKNNAIDIQFIPWHRGWSHSLTFGALCGIIVWIITALCTKNWLYPGWMFAAVVTFGLWTHVLEDQLGHLGSNLFYPFTKERSEGFHLMHANDAIPNFLTVWLSVAAIFWNMYRVLPQSGHSQIHINGLHYLLYVVVIPVGLLLIGAFINKKKSANQEEIHRPEEQDEEEVAM